MNIEPKTPKSKGNFWSTVGIVLIAIFGVIVFIIRGLIRFCIEMYAIATDNKELQANLRAKDIQEELQEMTAQQVLKKYSLFGKNTLEPKTEGEYRVLEKLESNPLSRIIDLLSEKEFEWLITMILRFFKLID
jgi:hypothetical protein